MRRHTDGSFDDEELVREGGVLMPRNGGHEVGPDDGDGPRSDYAEDPNADDGVPGTRDDLPYDFGVENVEAADHLLLGPDRLSSGFGRMGSTEADGDTDEPPLGAPDERTLWRKQRPLIQESEREESHLEGLEDAEVAKVRDAEAENAEEALPDFPEGESATGAS